MLEMSVDFKYGKDVELMDRADLMYGGLIIKTDFLARYSTVVPKLAQLEIEKEAFRVAFHEAKSKDVVKVERRRVKREDLCALMTNIGQIAVAAAADDPSILHGTGIEVKRKRGSSAHSDLQVPSNFTVVHGTDHGTMVGKVTKLEGAGGFEIFVTDGDPTVLENWKLWASFISGMKMEMTGFQPGKNYSFKIRGVSANSSRGPWSPVISLIAI